MLKTCKYCGQQYNGDSGSSACQECAEKVKKKTVLPRVCRECGKSFPGGPRAWYCPDCRAERLKAQSAAHKQRGTARPLGSIDKCVVCGGDYVVNSGRQRYCPSCAPEAVRAIDRKQSIAWNKENTTPDQRRMERNNSVVEIHCCICGKKFRPTDSSRTCSASCAAELHRRNQSAWEKKNRDYRNQYQRERIKKHVESMTPEEYREYREKINLRARENYWKRKEKENQK